ncbi:putative DNA topoisomerase (ATP-hydrolyzing) [Rosa chinensis]|uniref:Putative DNA topoisomerase (ATP-hydrolyzing) n=1 Tax=Rosa chinensis TaxID=74649 RepID=A0A2P6SNS2_ROSCH|nr:putative DNA topoisomerase (ATP-hydrolyzing) [Rosa chinensis]
MLKFHVFALMDYNPHGLKISGIYRFGSKSMSYDHENLTDLILSCWVYSTQILLSIKYLKQV